MPYPPSTRVRAFGNEPRICFVHMWFGGNVILAGIQDKTPAQPGVLQTRSDMKYRRPKTIAVSIGIFACTIFNWYPQCTPLCSAGRQVESEAMPPSASQKRKNKKEKKTIQYELR